MAFRGLGKGYWRFTRTKWNEIDESVVGVPLVTASLACVEDSATFICRT